LDSRLNPLEVRAGEGGGLAMTDIFVSVVGGGEVKDGDTGDMLETHAHSQ